MHIQPIFWKRKFSRQKSLFRRLRPIMVLFSIFFTLAHPPRFRLPRGNPQVQFIKDWISPSFNLAFIPSTSNHNLQPASRTMPKDKRKKKQLVETHLKQNYVDENDLIPFLRDRFEEFRIRVCLWADDNLIRDCVEGGFVSTDMCNVDTRRRQ